MALYFRGTKEQLSPALCTQAVALVGRTKVISVMASMSLSSLSEKAPWISELTSSLKNEVSLTVKI